MSYGSLKIIIDGYNLLMTCGLVTPNRIGPGTLHWARQRIVKLLERKLPKDEIGQTAIVFDTNRESESPINSSDMQVLFSTGYADADSMIIEMIRQNSVPQKLLVVSSDHRIQTAANRRNAKFVDSDEWFFEELGAVRQEVTVTPTDDELLKGNQKSLSDSDSLTWTNLFSEEKTPDSKTLKSDQAADDPSDDSGQTDDSPKTWNPFPDDYADDLFDDS